MAVVWAAASRAPGVARTSMQLQLSPVLEDYCTTTTPTHAFCGLHKNNIMDPPILDLGAPATKLLELDFMQSNNNIDHESKNNHVIAELMISKQLASDHIDGDSEQNIYKSYCTYDNSNNNYNNYNSNHNNSNTEQIKNKSIVTAAAATITDPPGPAAKALFLVIIREKLLQWSKAKIRPILDKKKITPVAAAGHNNSSSSRRRSSGKPAENEQQQKCRSDDHVLLRCVNPLRVLARIPQAYVNMMNGIGNSAVFNSPGMATAFGHVLAPAHRHVGRTIPDDHFSSSSREYSCNSDESIAKILRQLAESGTRSSSNCKLPDDNHPDYAMHQYYNRRKRSSIGAQTSSTDHPHDHPQSHHQIITPVLVLQP